MRMRARKRPEPSGFTEDTVTLPPKTRMSSRSRPSWDPTWAVQTGNEDDLAVPLHTEGRRFNYSDIAKNPKDAKNHLDDWDALLTSSPLNAGANPKELMDNTKAFFMSCGFTSPRSTVGFTDSTIEKLLKYAANQNPDRSHIFAPQNIREELGISQAVSFAKEYQNLEWQAQNFGESAANKKGEETVGQF